MRSRGALAVLAVTAMLTSACVGAPAGTDTARNSEVGEFSLTIGANALDGGKNANTATWMRDYVIPGFVEAQRAKGVTATVRFEGNGADDKDCKTKIALDLRTGGGTDIQEIDGI